MTINFSNIRGLFFDLDGTLTIDGNPLPGAAATLALLNRKGLPFRLCTNTTTLARATMTQRLLTAGLSVSPDQVFSAPVAALEYLRRRRFRSCHLLLAEDTLRDFAEISQDDVAPAAIVIGDIGERWNYTLMNELFTSLRAGAELVVLHKGKYWYTGGREKVDIGAFIAGLEYATGKPAIVIGKPSPDFYRLALASLNLPPNQVAMVGDDLDNDVAGAQAVGLNAILVQTGKSPLPSSKAIPDLTLPSVAELARLFD